MGPRWKVVFSFPGLLLALILVDNTVAAQGRKDLSLDDHIAVSAEYMMRNISPPGAATGAVVAATSKNNPDYFYHWIRDAGLIFDVVVDLYRKAPTAADKGKYFTALRDFISFSRKNQLTPNPSGHMGLGEPKFHADGSAFTGPWGRPQNDGPAVRAIALIRLAGMLLDEGEEAYVRRTLYDSKFPTESVIKADLEFVAKHWRESCFDLWEEVRGHNFYTRMVQRRALLDGARLAARLGDKAAAEWYVKQGHATEVEIHRHWKQRAGIIVPTLDRDGGIDYKHSGLDASIVLASMHADAGDGFYGVTDDRVLSTFQRLRAAFASLYPINHKGLPADAIGRYPEDKYDGFTSAHQGNPWVLLTLGFGEFLHRAARAFETKGAIEVNATNVEFFRSMGLQLETNRRARIKEQPFKQIIANMRSVGDAFIARARLHAAPGGRFSEQINRVNGYMQGAENLTWSYGSFLTAVWQMPAFRD